jgi:CheY-like chemotaxis protein
MNIFYCDDDQDDIEFFKKAVNKINPKITCTTSLDAEEALNILAFEEEKPDAIFIDLHMPKFDGLECVIAIKRNKGLKRIPLIILSNGLGKLQIEQFNKLGVFRFVSKTTFEDLESSLRHVLMP